MTNERLDELLGKAQHARECREYIPLFPDVVVELIAEVNSLRLYLKRYEETLDKNESMRAQLTSAREVIEWYAGPVAFQSAIGEQANKPAQAWLEENK